MLPEITRLVEAGTDLEAHQAEAALDWILEGKAEDSEIGRLLVALSEKGEHPREIQGFADSMRRRVRSFPVESAQLVDTAGTGGGKETFNISTTAAFVIAGAGLRVAKHGNRAVTSRSGSADLLEALGVRIDCDPATANRCLEEAGFAFLFAPLYHPAMKRVAEIRRRLGRRTIFNLLGPLTNPLGAPHQLIGVYSPELTPRLAGALSGLGCRRAWVVHSADGLDEVSSSHPSRVSSVEGDEVRTFDFDPSPCGFSQDLSPLPSAGMPERNADITLQILEGRVGGKARDLVLINAAAAISLVRGEALEDSLPAARESLDSGAALERLRRLIEVSQST